MTNTLSKKESRAMARARRDWPYVLTIGERVCYCGPYGT
jgi:hypothetical protein